MTSRFHIASSSLPRPPAKRIAFCDGSGDATFREGIDIDLSHWVPNRTPQQFKADTSTEICMNAVAAGAYEQYDLAVNNHADVDGMLSVFTLMFPEVALQHRVTLIQAAVMGDFYGWGEDHAQHLYQALALLLVALRERRTDPQSVYELCFDRVHASLGGQRFAECDAGVRALNRSVALIGSGRVERIVVGDRFVLVVLPRELTQGSLAEGSLADALFAPAFCQPLSGTALLPPHARAKLDAERVQLISIATETGWYYDLWYPGYAWADTVTCWRPPGIRLAGNSDKQVLEFAALSEITAELNRRDSMRGAWKLTGPFSIFGSEIGRPFPIVLSHMRDGAPAPSDVKPSEMAELLAPVFRD